MAEDLVWLHLKAALPPMDHVNREEVLRILREIEAGRITQIGNTSVGMRRAQVALLRVGDRETIRKALDTFRDYNSPEAIVGVPKAFEYAHSPVLVAYLAEEFDSDENPEGFADLRHADGTPAEYAAPPRSVYAGVIAMRVILKDAAFSPELKAWAAEMISVRGTDPKEFRRRLKVWWKQNRGHFDQADYGKVERLVESESDSPPPPSSRALVQPDIRPGRIDGQPTPRNDLPAQPSRAPLFSLFAIIPIALLLAPILLIVVRWRGRKEQS